MVASLYNADIGLSANERKADAMRRRDVLILAGAGTLAGAAVVAERTIGLIGDDASPTDRLARAIPEGVTTHLVSGDFEDNGYEDERCNPFARVVLQTTASRMAVECTTTIMEHYPDDAEVNVSVNGSDVALLEMTEQGVNIFPAVALGQGGVDKRVELTIGLQSRPNDDVLGTFLRSIRTDAPATVVHEPKTRRLLIYGDSLSQGSVTPNVTREAWPVLIRRAFDGQVIVEGWGYRSLWEDARDDDRRAAFVQRLTNLDPTDLWFAIGTNDYGLNRWGSSEFGNAYAAVADEINRALPTTRLYCQSPIQRISPATEATNELGDTLDDYRAQIEGVAESRPWCVHINGANERMVPSTELYEDGIHLTQAANVTYAARVMEEIER